MRKCGTFPEFESTCTGRIVKAREATDGFDGQTLEQRSADIHSIVTTLVLSPFHIYILVAFVVHNREIRQGFFKNLQHKLPKLLAAETRAQQSEFREAVLDIRLATLPNRSNFSLHRCTEVQLNSKHKRKRKTKIEM